MVCKKCGAMIRANTPVCPICGTPLDAAEAARPANSTDPRPEVPVSAPQHAPKAQPDPVPQPKQDPRSQPNNPVPPQYQYPRQQAGSPVPPQYPRTPSGPVPPQYTPQYTPQPHTKQKKRNLLPLILIACIIGVLVIVFAVLAIVLAGRSRTEKTPAAAETAVTEAADIEAAADIVTAEQTDYEAAVAQMEAGSYREAAEQFEALDDYRDSADLAERCLKAADYTDALTLMEAGNYQDAASLLQQLGDYADSADLLAQCSLCLPQSVLDELDEYFRQTLQDTFNGASWAKDYLDNMELLGRYELIGKTNGSSDNVVYLLYRVTAHNSATGTGMDYYWFGRCDDVAVSGSGEESDAGRSCFTNGAGDAYRLYLSGSSYYYYGFSTEDDFYVDQISPLESDYYQTWTPAE